MRIGIQPGPGLNKEKRSWVKQQLAKRELKKLGKEIESVRELLSSKYDQTQDMQSPAVRIISSHLDTLVIRYQQLSAEVDHLPSK